MDNHVLIKGYRKVPEKVPLANVWLEVGENSMQRKVAVMDDATEPVLLGMDLGLLLYLLELEMEEGSKDGGFGIIRGEVKVGIDINEGREDISY